MKINKYISIDEEIFKRLKRETNASDIINTLLKDYYNKEQCENIEKLTENLNKFNKIHKENLKNMREIKQKISKIKQKEQFILSKVKSRDKLIELLKEKRQKTLQNPYRRITYNLTISEEADHILKGGRQIS